MVLSPAVPVGPDPSSLLPFETDASGLGKPESYLDRAKALATRSTPKLLSDRNGSHPTLRTKVEEVP